MEFRNLGILDQRTQHLDTFGLWVTTMAGFCEIPMGWFLTRSTRLPAFWWTHVLRCINELELLSTGLASPWFIGLVSFLILVNWSISYFQHFQNGLGPKLGFRHLVRVFFLISNVMQKMVSTSWNFGARSIGCQVRTTMLLQCWGFAAACC